MRVKLVDEAKVYGEVYIDRRTGVYSIQGLYLCGGELGDLGIGDIDDFYLNWNIR